MSTLTSSITELNTYSQELLHSSMRLRQQAEQAMYSSRNIERRNQIRFSIEGVEIMLRLVRREMLDLKVNQVDGQAILDSLSKADVHLNRARCQLTIHRA